MDMAEMVVIAVGSQSTSVHCIVTAIGDTAKTPLAMLHRFVSLQGHLAKG
jgi:hypothetical protein